jgi:26S proteasome regulatory subunit N1
LFDFSFGRFPSSPNPRPTAAILKDSHHLLFHLCLSMSPRILSTFDEDLNPVSVSVRVGQAVDVVGQAGTWAVWESVVPQHHVGCDHYRPLTHPFFSHDSGKPKTITGFVTNNTPVLLGFGERAQLGTEEYEALTPILEGFVIVRKKKEGGEATADTA